MRRARLLRGVTLLATAAAGILAAHELDYRLIVPDPAHRHDLLLRSGHGYLSHMLAIGVVATLLAAVGSLSLGARTRERGRSLGGTAASLALVQSGGFLALEAIERLIVGAPADDRLLAVTVVGVALQGLSAAVGAALLGLLERAGAAIARRLDRRPFAAPRGCPSWTATRGTAPGSRLPGSRGARAPPAFAV